MAFDSQKYPLVTAPTKDALDLDAQQEQKSMELAINKFGITNSGQYLDLTLDYLADFVVFEQIKAVTNLEKYTYVNFMIYVANKEEGSDAELEQYTSVTLEKDLKEYLAKNPHVIEKGLKLIGKEFPTQEVGNIDLLLSDKKGYDVVVELKKDRESDNVVGQICRYMGWVIKNRKKKTRGIIVVSEPDPKLEYAIVPLRDVIKLKYYRVRFDLSENYKTEKSNLNQEL